MTTIVRPRPRRDCGFTLLEVLVALSIMGFLLVGLTYGLRTGLALWGVEQRHLNETVELDAAARALRSILTRIPMPDGRPVTRFQGDASNFTFVGEMPTGLGTSRLAEMRLTLEHASLALWWTPFRHRALSGAAPAPIETDLIRGVARLELGYYGSVTPDGPPSWQTGWDALYPPELIRVRVTFPAGDLRRWPDLLVAPPL